MIRANRDNIAVKLPQKIYPATYYSRIQTLEGGETHETVSITVDPNITGDFYQKFEFAVYVNGELKTYLADGSDMTLSFVDDDEIVFKPSFDVRIEGRYIGRNGYVYEFETPTMEFRYYLVCSETTLCSESALVRDMHVGYYHEGAFYASYDQSSEAQYSDQIPAEAGTRYYDLPTGATYVYNYDYENSRYEQIER